MHQDQVSVERGAHTDMQMQYKHDYPRTCIYIHIYILMNKLEVNNFLGEWELSCHIYTAQLVWQVATNKLWILHSTIEYTLLKVHIWRHLVKCLQINA